MASNLNVSRGWLPGHAGVLTALPRPSDYVERRDDGYQVSLTLKSKAPSQSVTANEASHLGHDEIFEACCFARGESV